MIGQIILLCVFIVSTVFTIMSVYTAISKKMSIVMSLIPIGFSAALGVGLLLVYLGI